MTVKELFDFVTDPTVNESNMDEYLEKSMKIASNRGVATLTEKTEDEVFKGSYIPTRMDEVVDFERDFRRAKQGESLIYTTLHGLESDLSKPRKAPEILEDETKIDKPKNELQNESESETDSESEDEDGSESDSEEKSGEENSEEEQEESENNSGTVIHFRPRDESPNSKKARKQAVKEEKREKRKIKTPKHIKKRAEKLAKIKKNK
jgi:RIO kinase 1